MPCPELPFPAPLHEGMPIDLYEKYVAPPPPTEEEASALEVFVSNISELYFLSELHNETNGIEDNL